MSLRPVPITLERYEPRWTWKTWAWLAAATLSLAAFCACVAYTLGYVFTRFFN